MRSRPAVILKRYREAHGLTKAQLADILHVSRPTVTRWENGDRRVDRDLWARVSKATGIPQAALAGIDDWQPSERRA